MSTRGDLADAIAFVEECVRSGERITLEALSGAFAALLDLQAGQPLSSNVARAAQAVEHWLSQYVATQIDRVSGVPDRDREATLRRITLFACEDLRITIARSWMGAA